MIARRAQLLLCSVLVLTNVLCTALHHRSKSKSGSSTTSPSSSTHEDHTPRADPSNDGYTLHFSLWRDPDTFTDQCNLGVTDSNVSLWYRNASELEWAQVVGSFFNTENDQYDVLLPHIDTSGTQFRWVQSEHGGGSCNCWRLDNVQLLDTYGENWMPLSFNSRMNNADAVAFSCANSNTSPNLHFCDGSASVPRGVVSRMINLRAETIECIGDESEVLMEPVGHSPISNVACSNTSQPFIRISFLLHIGDELTRANCDRVDAFPEGVELAGYLSNKWVPLLFYTPASVRNIPQCAVAISENVGGDDILLRGYTIPVRYTNSPTIVTEYICGEQFIQDGVQFRFMQTVRRGYTHPSRDVWTISSLNVIVHKCSENCSVNVLEFRDTSTSLDPTWMVKGGHVTLSSNVCGMNAEGNVLAFDQSDPGGTTIISRIIVTPPLDLSIALEELECLGTGGDGMVASRQPSSALQPTSMTPLPSPTMTSSSIVLPSSTRLPSSASHSLPTSTLLLSTSSSMEITIPVSSTPPASTVLAPSSRFSPVVTPHPSATVVASSATPFVSSFSLTSYGEEEEERLHEIIKADPDLKRVDSLINDGDLEYAIVLLEKATFHHSKNSAATVLLMAELEQGIRGENITTNFTESFVGTASNMITAENQAESQEPSTTAGSTLLDVLDRYALRTHNQDEPLITTNIALVVQTIIPKDMQEESIVGISQNNHTIQIPREVLENTNRSQVRMATYLYQDMSGLLPGSLPNNTNSMRLASSVVSSALQCGEERCDTSSINLTTPVRIQFRNTPEVQREIEDGASVTCVFWEFEPLGTILMSGHWAVKGCERSCDSTADTTICECNHLTHFALLLSPAPPEFSEEETISLEIIGIVGVTVSLLALTITIATFIFLRSLWTMRNYIHVNLCANLIIAQLIFIVGVEPRGSTASCQAIAVILHYFFLVTFMWMLMEGVVLYVALVKVFIKNQGRYIIAFTVFSYGLPLLYLGLTVPLGLALENGPHYAGDDPEACWLRYDTHFIWAFIAPVILIILVNVGFFIMAVTIMYKHQKRQTHKTKIATVRHWLKASISLVIVMGITWIIGVLIFHEALIFIAWIFTILVGLQGLAIFILFVVLSKQVREAYWKWWKVKKSESDFLSKHFGEKTISTTVGAMRRTSVSDKSKSIAMDFSVADRDAITTHLENEVEEPPAINYTAVFSVDFFPNPTYEEKAKSPPTPEDKVVNMNNLLLDPEKSATVLENDYAEVEPCM